MLSENDDFDEVLQPGPGKSEKDQSQRVIDRLVTFADEGMASGVDETFDIDAFIEDTRSQICGGSVDRFLSANDPRSSLRA